jgi:dihydropteroate synthase-like protein
VEHIVFLTGRLAEPSLRRVLGALADAPDPPFTWEVREIGLQVAALMTADMIRRRVALPVAADRMLVPGRCRGDVAALSAHFGIPVERGPDELKDLPRHFARAARPIPLDRHDIDILAEIVDAPQLTVEAIVARAAALRADGADVIDLGCLPDTPFPHLADAVRALKAAGHRVSVDSQRPEDLVAGGRAGADLLLSLTVDTLWVCDHTDATPVLIGREPQDEASLDAAIDALRRRGRPFYADAILDPIPFGFTKSLLRYQRLATRHPDVPILMGVGNLTELVEADTSGINALLFGIAVELGVRAVLTTQVSPHARRAVAEAELARRLMFAAREHRMLPKGLTDALMTVHDRRPHPDTDAEIDAVAAEVRDPNFRVQVTDAGIHVYNRAGHQRVQDPFDAFAGLDLAHDGAHAFYMGVEMGRAEIAWRLGKRYVQDRPLDWGVAAPARGSTAQCAPADAIDAPAPAAGAMPPPTTRDPP